ncbi:DUF732 domain-containing protein [Geodermatophilus sp. SYSU D01062]
MTRRTAVVVTALAAAVFAAAVAVTLVLLRMDDPAPAPSATAPASTTADEDGSSESSSAPTRTTATTRTTPRPGEQVMDVSPEADARYLATLSAAGLLTPGTDEQQVIEVGRLVCAFISTGQGDVDDAGVLVHQSGEATPGEAGTIVGAAVSAYCPQYGDGL